MPVDLAQLRSQAASLLWNVLDWFVSMLPFISTRAHNSPPIIDSERVCVSVPGPGGVGQLRLTNMQRCTVGYNVPGIPPPYVTEGAKLPDDCCVVRVSYFSINYADIAIRWGLYDSALRYVGWPIVPGFDLSGTVEAAGSSCGFSVGDEVFGVTMFGAYSTKVLIPGRQLRKRPAVLSPEDAAALPAVGGTALHALALAGFWPAEPLSMGRAVLIHSAAGGVGSMLVQMCKLAGCRPIVAVVGAPHKVDACKDLGADVVIDKSSQNLWAEARKVCPAGFAAIFDANGVATLSDSYSHLSLCGRLVVYGYHTNVPRGRSLLGPLDWLKMLWGMARMPRFDPMDMTLTSKAVLGFNLSFFADEHRLLDKYMAQLSDWVEEGKLRLANVHRHDLDDVAGAQERIQTGRTVGKIVVRASLKKGE